MNNCRSRHICAEGQTRACYGVTRQCYSRTEAWSRRMSIANAMQWARCVHTNTAGSAPLVAVCDLARRRTGNLICQCHIAPTVQLNLSVPHSTYCASYTVCMNTAGTVQQCLYEHSYSDVITRYSVHHLWTPYGAHPQWEITIDHTTAHK